MKDWLPVEEFLEISFIQKTSSNDIPLLSQNIINNTQEKSCDTQSKKPRKWKKTILISILLLSLIAISFISFQLLSESAYTDSNGVNNIMNGGIATKSGNWIYYATSNGIYKVTSDGSNTKKLDDSTAYYLNVIDSWIYFIDNNDHGIYKIGINGGSKVRLNKNITAEDCLYSSDNWIYFLSQEDEIQYSPSLYRMDLSGANVQKINNDIIFNTAIFSNWFFFEYYNSDYTTQSNINKMKIDNTGKILLNLRTRAYTVYKNHIYYANSDDNDTLYKADVNGEQQSLYGF